MQFKNGFSILKLKFRVSFSQTIPKGKKIGKGISRELWLVSGLSWIRSDFKKFTCKVEEEHGGTKEDPNA